MLQGKRVLVTGGSRGIGAGICNHLANLGARVALTYTSRAADGEAVMQSLPGDGHLCLRMDVSDKTSVEEGIHQVIETFGGLDGLVNNAGITRDQLLLRMKDEDFDQVIATNLRGVFLCSRAVAKTMMKARSGSIVNITSVIGQMGNAGQCNYAASKAGAEGFARSMARELGSRGVRVNCVAPGFIVTDMTETLDEQQKNAILQQVPLQRLGQTSDVAAAVAFLLSDGATYITGQTLGVNGGMHM